ncbi:MAG: hypothetical protein IJ583_09015 [Firmicutes bacterium]|nr:hypothetical protein [Bacillota bacterium]
MLKQLLSNIEKYNADAKYNIDTGVKAVINEKEFTVILSDTKAAKEFSNILPKTLEMSELNGNEKYIYLDTSFSSEPQKVGHINAGDIMLYGDNCIVIFYKSFDTPYSYTLIGHIDNAEDLAETVGSDDITAVFTN